MTDLHGKKGLNSLKLLVFRSLSPGQHKLYPAVPKTEANKKALELSNSKAFLAEDMGLEPTGLLHLTRIPSELLSHSVNPPNVYDFFIFFIAPCDIY